MVFWRRINQSKLQLILNQYRRFHFQPPHASSVNQTMISALEKPFCSIENKPSYFYINVRSFAAPVQATKNKKVEQKDKEKPRLNKQITASVVRLVMEDGQHAVVSIEEALQQARKQGVDLVEVQKKVDPSVCRLMDYNKEMYQRRQKEKEVAKSKSGDTLKKGVCDIRFKGKIEEKDLKLKAENVIRLAERGYRVKCMAMGKGKDGEGEDLGRILSRLTKLIEGVCVVETELKVEKTNAHVIVRHAKFGLTKKGGGKKSKVADGDTAETSSESATDNQMSVDESMESGSESEDTPFSDKDDLPMSSPMQMQDEKVDNRYKRSEPSNQFPPANPVRSEPQFPSPRREPPNMSQSTRESVRSELQFRYAPRQPPQNIGQNIRQADRSKQVGNEASKSPTSFGIFSSPNKNSSGKQGTSADATVSNEGNRYAHVRNRGMGGNAANPKSDSNRKPGNNKGGQDKLGIFSNPNGKP
ncbi:translation initiation factor IF3-1, mitochondrial-like [Hibiscus syriacus]|uniref:translation initiation factor IF3-1, mitochondrial-like n=1 Tax=Hibiscus syriacus TaxID=106335 RepID=UPI00192403B2|nr:translation initiation factor IF3-1, mitochondrial-like [Hibiscus syriacus]